MTGVLPRRVLLVDDDPALAAILRLRLESEGFTLEAVPDGTTALARARTAAFDLLMLDGVLPGLDGLVLCRALRTSGANRETPILMISARDSEADRILGLESGADDYLPKPFGFDELLARMRALLRRSTVTGSHPGGPGHYEVGGVRLDVSRQAASVEGRTVPLTRREFDLLRVLMSRPGVVFSRQALLDEVWAGDEAVTPRTIDALVAKLRRKIEDDAGAPSRLLRERGVGYRFADAR